MPGASPGPAVPDRAPGLPDPAGVPLGLVLPLDRHQGPVAALSLAGAAERAGISRVCAGELASYDSLALLAAIAVSTTRVGLFSTVVSTLARSPAQLAMSAATLAALSGGRYRLGLGAGSDSIGAWHGRPLTAPVATMRSAITSIRTALTGGMVPGGGFRLITAPPPPVPIYLAALNPRMIELAASLADGVVLTFAGPEQVGEIAATVRAGADRAGRPRPDLVATCWMMAGAAAAAAEQRIRETIAGYFAVGTYQRMARSLAGPAAAGQIGAAFRAGGRAAAARLIPDAVLDAVTAPPSEAGLRAAVGRYVAAGAASVHVVPIRADARDASVLDVIKVMGAAAAPAPA